MFIIYDNKTHMYISEIVEEDGKVTFSFTSTQSEALKVRSVDDKLKSILSNRDVNYIELDQETVFKFCLFQGLYLLQYFLYYEYNNEVKHASYS